MCGWVGGRTVVWNLVRWEHWCGGGDKQVKVGPEREFATGCVAAAARLRNQIDQGLRSRALGYKQ